MYYLSFDCATKTLGICLLYYNENWRYELEKAVNDKDVKQIQNVINNAFKLIYSDSFYISELKEKPEVKARILRKELDRLGKEYIDKLVPMEELSVVIEFQMSSNIKSRLIFHYLLYHYCSCYVIVIPAARKNMLNLTDIKIQDFIEKYASSYTANKKHATHNYLYFTSLYKLDVCSGKKKKDDEADALMQALAAIKFEL